jgi:hypothetical protein
LFNSQRTFSKVDVLSPESEQLRATKLTSRGE